MPQSLTAYLTFTRAHLRFLAFGFLLTATSSAGQTFFIGLFGPQVRAAFGLSHSEWGSLYLVGTLASALVLPWSGQIIDRVDLRVFTAASILGLAGACLAMSLVPSVAFLVVAIFLLRQFGQGLTSHTATVAMARYFGPDRGKALALASIGFSLAEATLPILAVLAITAWGWRQSYAGTALIVLCLLPVALWLLKGHGARHQAHEANIAAARSSGLEVPGYSRKEMLREARFYLLLPAAMAPSYVGTAMFFHHLTLAEAKDWSAVWVTGSYWIYALAAAVTMLAAGPLIDRLTAARIMPLFLLPLALGLGFLAWGAAPFWVLPYLALLGVTTGFAFTGLVALWAELYGARHLGAIKSLAGGLGVLASALGPVTVGLALDAGHSIETVCLGFAGFCLFATLLLMRALKAQAMPQTG